MSNPEPRQLMKTICSPKNQTCRAAIPAPNFFPNDFKPLANACHAAGVKFGIHMMRGIPRAAVEANTPIEGSSVRARDIADPVLYGPALEAVEWKTADDQFLPVNPKKQP